MEKKRGRPRKEKPEKLSISSEGSINENEDFWSNVGKKPNMPTTAIERLLEAQREVNRGLHGYNNTAEKLARQVEDLYLQNAIIEAKISQFNLKTWEWARAEITPYVKGEIDLFRADVSEALFGIRKSINRINYKLNKPKWYQFRRRFNEWRRIID